jgi:hypothetical protein
MSGARNGTEADRTRAPEGRLGYEGQRGPGSDPPSQRLARRVFRRGPWENASAIVIGLGILMQMQPFALELYTWSFAVVLAGTLGFLVTSHFPD